MEGALKQPSTGEQELGLLRHVADRGGATVGEVADSFGAERGLARSTYGAVSVGAVWLVCRLAPRLPASVRTLLWWCAALKILVDLVWLAPIPVPVLRQPAAATFAGTVTRVAAVATDLATKLGLRREPCLRVSADVRTPFVSGLGRPIVVLPARLVDAWPEPALRMALCHELAHVKRADTLWGCVPAVAECLLFFHPLARLAAREYSLGREAACDAVVLSVVDAAPREYGRLLIGLGVARLDAGMTAAGASCSFSNLKRRIAMLRLPQALSSRTRLVAAGAIAAAALALLPVQLVARPAPAPAPSIEVGRPVGLPPATLAPPGATTEAPTDRASSPQRANPAQAKPAPERDLRYVFFTGRDESTMMSGSSQDIEHARQFRKAGESLLWFRLNGREYVVRDAAVLRQFEDIWRPVGEIGNEEGKLGARQGALVAKQGEIGRKQGEIGAEQGKLGARQGEIGARQGELASRQASQNLSAAEKADIEKQFQQIDQQMRELDVQMKQLDEKMRAFDQPMRDLGDQMKALGKEMEVLGRKMEEASAKAEAATKSLLERTIASGAAQPVK